MPKWTTTASAMFMLTWEHLIRTQFSSESYARSWFWNVIKGTKCHKMKIFGKVASSRTRAEKIQDKSGALYNTIRWSVSCFSHVWLCDPMKCSPPGSSVHEISQASILEWVARSCLISTYSEILGRLKKSKACSKGCDCGGISKRMNCSRYWAYWLAWRQAGVLCAYSVVACRTLECSACHCTLVCSSHLSSRWMGRRNHWVVLSCSSTNF